MKKTIAILIATIITFTAVLCACDNKGDDTGTTSTTTEQSTETSTELMTAELTTAEPMTAEPTTKVKPTAPSVPEWCEEIEVKASELPMKLDGVNFKKAVFYKATTETEDELSEYGDDPYIHNKIYVFVEGDSADLQITYNGEYVGNVNASAFFEDDELIWRDHGLGTKPLNISVEDEKATVSGFSSDLAEITHQARMFQEFIEMDGTFVKSLTFLFV